MKYGEEFVYIIVATVLTVYGIETEQLLEIGNHILRVVVATVLTVYGIETPSTPRNQTSIRCRVATVLTVYGIETFQIRFCQ